MQAPSECRSVDEMGMPYLSQEAFCEMEWNGKRSEVKAILTFGACGLQGYLGSKLTWREMYEARDGAREGAT